MKASNKTSESIDSWGIHWFRRDLRLPGNKALKENCKRTRGRTLGLFCFDARFLARSDFSNNRFAFFLKTLKALKEDFKEQGGDLLISDGAPQEVFPKILAYCKSKKINLPSLITWNRDYEPFARRRDLIIERILKSEGISVSHHRDHLLFEPHEIQKGDTPGNFYQIYSPFSRKWFEHLKHAEGRSRIESHDRIFDYYEKKIRSFDLFKIKWVNLTQYGDFPFHDTLESFQKLNQSQVQILIPEAGFYVAFKALMDFKEKLQFYNEKRDFPAAIGTSKLAMYFKNGSITVPQAIRVLDLSNTAWSEKSGPNQFLKELVWREFYYSILFHKPEVESKSYLPQYENIQWENNVHLFESWKEGRTGFPIVDAGMRELAATGWMHNRVRMIVASFLTKDLLIDWRWGENYFMKQLLDGDLAPNNGGWQWAASTGCDPQPYFRIFNPWLQGKKFDPNGDYIKTYIPELRGVDPRALHDPDADRGSWRYPSPIVDHSQQRSRALQLYKR